MRKGAAGSVSMRLSATVVRGAFRESDVNGGKARLQMQAVLSRAQGLGRARLLAPRVADFAASNTQRRPIRATAGAGKRRIRDEGHRTRGRECEQEAGTRTVSGE